MDQQLIEKRLRDIDVQQAEILILLQGLAEKMEDRIIATDEWRVRTDRILIGDGNGQKGHNVRIDRLEQAQERSKRWTWGVLIPVILLALKAISEFWAHTPPG